MTPSQPARRPVSFPVEPLLTPAEVGQMFRVDPKTVTRWAQTGRLPSFKTPGGHRRFREADIRRFLDDSGPDERTDDGGL